MKEDDYPEVGDGPVRFADYAYLVDAPLDGEDTNQWLNQKAVDGWGLVSVDNGRFYFRRDERCIYEIVDGELERRRFGKNS